MPVTAPTSFTIPTEVRLLASSKAAADGLSLASAVRLLLAGYAAGRITISASPAAAPAADAVTIDRVEEIPMDAGTRKLAGRVFAAVRKHGRR